MYRNPNNVGSRRPAYSTQGRGFKSDSLPGPFCLLHSSLFFSISPLSLSFLPNPVLPCALRNTLTDTRFVEYALPIIVPRIVDF